MVHGIRDEGFIDGNRRRRELRGTMDPAPVPGRRLRGAIPLVILSALLVLFALSVLFDKKEPTYQDTLTAYRNRDYANAFKDFQFLAKAGDARAQVRLARLYSKGDGLPRNPVLAHMWNDLAAAQGNKKGAREWKAKRRR